MHCRKSSILWTLAFLLTTASGVAAQSAAPAPATPRSLLDGVYTEEQAARGKATFAQRCGICHSTMEFSGQAFLRGWRGQPVRALYTHISDRMPFDNPGSLEPQEYTDILAYLFALNRLPAGESELPADEASQRQIRIETEIQ